MTVSPIESNLVEFTSTSSSFAISQYQLFSGPQGSGVFPTDGSTVTVSSNKINFDDFVFNPSTDRLKYLRTNTFYQNNVTDITSLLSLAIDATPISTVGAPTIYSVDFTMPASGSILYLVWDYRSTASPTPTPTPTPTSTGPTPTPTQTPTPTPTLTPTPTPVPYNYFIITPCSGGGGTLYSSVRASFASGVTSGDIVEMNDGRCYEITEDAAPANTNDYINVYVDCTACLTSNPTPTLTPTPTPTPTPVVVTNGS